MPPCTAAPAAVLLLVLAPASAPAPVPARMAATAATATTAATAATAAAAAAAGSLSPQAELGRRLFFEQRLSASGRLACASCHDPANAYAAPANAGPVMRGGARLARWGLRTVPSLRYLDDTPRFTRHGYLDTGGDREDIGPAGGFMLDGRADDLGRQALLPLLDPAEMANRSVVELAARLRSLSYAAEFAHAFPAASGTVTGPGALAAMAAAALARYELEDPSFHPYSSRFDRYLRGQGRLSADELAGLALFISPSKGNCAACHSVTTGPQGRPPDFTDHSFHALGVPRNASIPANRDPGFFDLGLCGPLRVDLRGERGYCGYFKTPTLRNAARRRYFFHNGRFGSLREVLRFYVRRDLDPALWYPRTRGQVRKFDDLPARLRVNVDTSDAPLNREPGDAPALSDAEIAQVISFLKTLDDAD